MTNHLKWFERAIYDLDTAKALMREKRFLYVMFMCQQAIEKGLKAYYLQKFSKQPPYIHNLVRLLKESELLDVFSKRQAEFLDDLNSFYLSSRYPDELDEMATLCTEQKCNQTIIESEEVIRWLQTKLIP